MKIFGILLTIVFIAGCTNIRITRENEVHTLEKPVLIDSAHYSLLKDSFDFDYIMPANQLLGSLHPKFPLAYGITNSYDINSLYMEGCLNPTGYSLIVEDSSGFKIINDQNDLKAIFAPIETKEEALSYICAFTGQEPKYAFEIESGFRKFVRTINTTYSIEKEDGFEVNLFDYRECGCGPHTYFMVIYRIKRSGEIYVKETVQLYEDPLQDGLCVD
jgi:hypothetical protein